MTFFIAIPAVGAGLIAWLTEVYPRFWWRNRKLTALAALGAVPVLILFPVAIFFVLAASGWLLAMQSRFVRTTPTWQPVRILAMWSSGSSSRSA